MKNISKKYLYNLHLQSLKIGKQIRNALHRDFIDDRGHYFRMSHHVDEDELFELEEIFDGRPLEFLTKIVNDAELINAIDQLSRIYDENLFNALPRKFEKAFQNLFEWNDNCEVHLID
jgi:hypothetical protein